MRVLLLGASNDTGDWFEGGRKRHEIVRDRLAEAYGEPVEVVNRSIWPRPDLASTVEGWMGRYEPDVVYLSVQSYWFSYESVPLRVQRLLGRFGPWFGDAGLRFAESPRWAYNPVFRGARRALQLTIGGDPHFTTQQVIERVSETIRLVLRHEGVVTVVKGPHSRSNYSTRPGGAARKERRRLAVHTALESLCRQLHVTYHGSEGPVHGLETFRGNRVGDGLHFNAELHELTAEPILAAIKKGLAAANRLPATADA
jgi:hypothetical protein